MKFFIALIFLPTILAAKKNFDIQHIVNCSGKNDLPLGFHVKVNNSAVSPNRIVFAGYVTVSEKIMGPIDITYEANRCDLKSENCEKFSALKSPGVCKGLNAGSGLLISNLLNAFHPPLKCPIMPGKYVIDNQSVDFSNIALLFVEGYIWIGTVRVTSTEGKNRKLAMCLQVDGKVTKIREPKRNGNRKSENN